MKKMNFDKFANKRVLEKFSSIIVGLFPSIHVVGEEAGFSFPFSPLTLTDLDLFLCQKALL